MTILIFLGVLVVLILVHEFGHFFVAKKSGIRVDEFGIGFPPKLYGKKIGETEYTLNALPLGGFVRIWGENPTDEDYLKAPENKRSFVQQPRYIQAAVLVAGVAMNIIFAFFLYTCAFMLGTFTEIENPENLAGFENIQLIVTSVLPNTPAATTLKDYDEILGLHTNSATLTPTHETITPQEISDFITSSNGNPVTFNILRESEPLTVIIQPEQGIFESDPERYGTGFTMSLVGIQQLSLPRALMEGATLTYHSLIETTVGLSGFFINIFKGQSDFSQVTGPVGIVGFVGEAASLGFTTLLMFSALISINLAVINLLPFPALDGGRLVFVFIEAIIRHPINPIIASRVNQFGFIALLTLMAIVTANDIFHFF